MSDTPRIGVKWEILQKRALVLEKIRAMNLKVKGKKDEKTAEENELAPCTF